MTTRTCQRLIASAFIVGATSVFLLLVRIWLISGAAPPLSLGTIAGALGWIIVLSACAVVIFHPKPESTFLGRFAFQKEPLLRDSSVGPKRIAGALALVVVALLSAVVTLLAFSGGLDVLFEKYVFS